MGICQCLLQQKDLNDNYSSYGVTQKDFVIERVLGKRGFGKVLLVTKKDTKQIYAMKIIKKSNVRQKLQKKYIEWKRKILQKNSNNNNFLVALRYAFQTADKLYFVIDFCQGGELFYHLKEQGRFCESKTSFYSAQILLGLENLHNQDVIYRDLKPENCLLDENGNIKLSVFGLSKLIEKMTKNQLTFVERLSISLLKSQQDQNTIKELISEVQDVQFTKYQQELLHSFH